MIVSNLSQFITITMMILSSNVVDVSAYIITTTTSSSSISISRSSFVGRRNTFHSPSTTTLTRPHQRTSTTSTTTTTLHMNLFDRFSRVAKSNLNNILQNLEDPEKIMTQALEDMQVRHIYSFCVCVCRLLWLNVVRDVLLLTID